MPVHPLALYFGKMIAGIVRGLMTSGSVILVAIVFTGKVWAFLNPLFLLMLILNCAVFAGLGVILGLKWFGCPEIRNMLKKMCKTHEHRRDFCCFFEQII